MKLGGRRRERRVQASRVGVAELLQLLLKVVNAIFLLRVETRLILIHCRDVVVFAVEAVEVEGDAADLVLSFAHVPGVCGLDRDDMPTMGVLEVDYGHCVYFANVAADVSDDVAVADVLEDGDHGDRDVESD